MIRSVEGGHHNRWSSFDKSRRQKRIKNVFEKSVERRSACY
jgi:hypothetical protein